MGSQFTLAVLFHQVEGKWVKWEFSILTQFRNACLLYFVFPAEGVTQTGCHVMQMRLNSSDVSCFLLSPTNSGIITISNIPIYVRPPSLSL